VKIIGQVYLGNTHHLFPELTLLQLEIMALYSSGFTQKEIAKQRKTSQQAVSKTLNECRKIFNLENITSIRSVFLARRLLYIAI
jgi:DNA-binding CsgD family transcriptional regulator